MTANSKAKFNHLSFNQSQLVTNRQYYLERVIHFSSCALFCLWGRSKTPWDS